jgi:ABC-type Zn uptake system ZnuABC Zn-binding protein ZnuA
MILTIERHGRKPSESRRAVLGCTALLALAACIGLAGCATGGESGDGQASAVKVSATTGLLADITRQVAGGDAEVEQVIPGAASPHEFRLSAKDRAGVEDSDLLVSNGANLEQGIPIDEIDAPKFALADHVGALRPFDEDGESGEDPHVWMDPTKVAAALPALAGALAHADPRHATGYRERAGAYAEELSRLDARLKKMLSPVPQGDRKLVTSHDALGYFADRYGFTVIATPFPASGPDAEPSAATIEEVQAAVRESGVPTVFAQQDDDPEVLRRIAEDTGVAIIDDLHVEAPGSGETYAQMLLRDASLVRKGLGG